MPLSAIADGFNFGRPTNYSIRIPNYNESKKANRVLLNYVVVLILILACYLNREIISETTLTKEINWFTPKAVTIKQGSFRHMVTVLGKISDMI